MYVTQPKLIIRMAHQKVKEHGKENRIKINAQLSKNKSTKCEANKTNVRYINKSKKGDKV
jgi:hypothetical protein